MTGGLEALAALQAEREELLEWKRQALLVMNGLERLGGALGLPLGAQITGSVAVDAALDLRNERRRLVNKMEADMTLIDFLGKRIAEDEAGAHYMSSFVHIPPRIQYEADRVLAECAAKRAIVEEYANRTDDVQFMLGLRLSVQYLATPHSGHADYREEWRP